LIFRNVEVDPCGNCTARCLSPSANQPEETSAISNILGDPMTSAAQAFLMTAGIFALSFVAIFAVWYADRLRVGAPRKR
jgi:hypothetical protein